MADLGNGGPEPFQPAEGLVPTGMGHSWKMDK